MLMRSLISMVRFHSFIPSQAKVTTAKNHPQQLFGLAFLKKENFELWKSASPLTYVDKNTPPTLFINSSVIRMHAGRDDFMKVLKDNQIYVEVKDFADAPHSFPFFNPWFIPTVSYVDQFLKKVF